MVEDFIDVLKYPDKTCGHLPTNYSVTGEQSIVQWNAALVSGVEGASNNHQRPPGTARDPPRERNAPREKPPYERRDLERLVVLPSCFNGARVSLVIAPAHISSRNPSPIASLLNVPSALSDSSSSV